MGQTYVFSNLNQIFFVILSERDKTNAYILLYTTYEL